MTQERSDELYVAVHSGDGLAYAKPPITAEDRREYHRLDNIATIYGDRNEKVYIAAVGGDECKYFDPPATSAEMALYRYHRAYVERKTAEAKAEGRTIIFDIPFGI